MSSARTVRKPIDELAADDGTLDRGDRCSRELLLVRDANQHAIHFGYELEAETVVIASRRCGRPLSVPTSKDPRARATRFRRA